MPTPTVVFGLVGEGHRDQMLVEALLDHLQKTHPSPIHLVPHRLQPAYTDATRRRKTEGGDDKARLWCQTSPADRTRLAFSPPFPTSDKPACDIVVIVHDADNLQVMHDREPSIPLPTPPWDAPTRSRYVESVIDHWLWPSSSDRTTGNRHDDYAIVAAVRALESWYVAALDTTKLTPEELDAVSCLITLRPDMEDAGKPGKLKKFRVNSKYEEFNRSLVERIDHVATVCPQFHRLLDTLRQRLP